MAESAHARDLARCRRRLRLQGQALSGGDDRRLGGAPARRPVRWIATRTESFVSDNQARDHLTRAELALDADGRFLALRVETSANLGAYVSTFGAAIPSAIYSALLAGVYRDARDLRRGDRRVHQHAADRRLSRRRPAGGLLRARAARRRAAAELGIDRAEIRRRNLIPPRARCPTRRRSGRPTTAAIFPRSSRARWRSPTIDGFAQRREARGARGRLRGIGMACYVESSGVAPSRFAGMLGARVGFFEAAVDPRASRTARCARCSARTITARATPRRFAQILSSRLGVPLDKIEIVEGDTDVVPYGTGTFGSRSIAVGGSALDRAADKIIAKGKLIAAHLLEAAAGDVDFADGAFASPAPTGACRFAEVARAAYVPHNFPLETLEPGLQETAVYDPPELRLQQRRACLRDRDRSGHRRDRGSSATGRRRCRHRHQSDDRRGPGPWRRSRRASARRSASTARYDADGQLSSGSFMDYALPRADDLPLFVIGARREPALHAQSARRQGLRRGRHDRRARRDRQRGARRARRRSASTDIDMPLTPEAVWRAIASAKQAGASR